MKVKDLIELLKKEDPKAVVVRDDGHTTYELMAGDDVPERGWFGTSWSFVDDEGFDAFSTTKAELEVDPKPVRAVRL